MKMMIKYNTQALNFGVFFIIIFNNFKNIDMNVKIEKTLTNLEIS